MKFFIFGLAVIISCGLWAISCDDKDNDREVLPPLNKEIAMHTTTGTIKSGKFNLEYTIEGTGPTALVLGGARYYPRVFSRNLRKHLKMVFIDHRGFVPSPGLVDLAEFDLDVLLNDIELMRKLLNLGKVVIVGHSGHSYMALEYAKKYPHHVSAVVLIASGPDQSEAGFKAAEAYFQEHASHERKKALAESMQHLPAELEAHPERRLITMLIRLAAKGWYDYTYDPRPLWKDVVVNMRMVDRVWGEIFRDIDITRGLETFDKPVIVMLGKYDFIVAPPSSWDRVKSQFKNLTMEIFEKSGHTPQLEEQELFDEKLLGWLKRVGAMKS